MNALVGKVVGYIFLSREINTRSVENDRNVEVEFSGIYNVQLVLQNALLKTLSSICCDHIRNEKGKSK